jgi:hypothetical protein
MANVECEISCGTISVRAEIPGSEYRLLRQRAVATGLTMKEVVPRALHVYLREDSVDPNDPNFHVFPLGASGKKGHQTSRSHDDQPYGLER